jgi:hypothetical protein
MHRPIPYPRIISLLDRYPVRLPCSKNKKINLAGVEVSSFGLIKYQINLDLADKIKKKIQNKINLDLAGIEVSSFWPPCPMGIYDPLLVLP